MVEWNDHLKSLRSKYIFRIVSQYLICIGGRSTQNTWTNFEQNETQTIKTNSLCALFSGTEEIDNGILRLGYKTP